PLVRSECRIGEPVPQLLGDFTRRQLGLLAECGQQFALAPLHLADHLDQQPLFRPEVVDQHPVAGPQRGGDLAQAALADAMRRDVLHGCGQQACPAARARVAHVAYRSCTIWYRRRRPAMAIQDIDVTATTSAPAHAVHALLRDGATWPTWSPLGSFELERPAEHPDGVGEI